MVHARSLSSLILLAPLVSAARTWVDDASPRITYEGGLWLARSAAACSGCDAQLDTTRAFNGTFHDSSEVGTATLQFQGTGVEVYAIVRDVQPNESNYAFSIDGERVASYNFIGTGAESSGFRFNQSVFAVNNLTNGQHTLVVTNDPVSLILLDAIAIDTPDAVSSSASASASSAAASGSRSASVISASTTPSASASAGNTGSAVSVHTAGAAIGSLILATVAAVLAV